MSDPVYIIHVKVGDEVGDQWKPLLRSGKSPYVFGSGADAWRMVKACYSETFAAVRVTRIFPDRFREQFSSDPTPEIPQLLEVVP